MLECYELVFYLPQLYLWHSPPDSSVSSMICFPLLFFLLTVQGIWVEWWTEAQGRQSMYIGVYFLLAAGACMSFTFFFW